MLDDIQNRLQKIRKLLLVKPVSYAEAKLHSQQIDEQLHLNMSEIEMHVHKSESTADKNFWLKLDENVLMTPYSEFVEMTELLDPQPNDLWIDMGSGYGRLGVVLHFLAERTRYIGIEAVKERAVAAERVYQQFQMLQARSIQADLTVCEDIWFQGNVFFIYDFGSLQDIEKALHVLKKRALQSPITVIARGRQIRQTILNNHPWLYCNHQPEHHPHWSFFRS